MTPEIYGPDFWQNCSSRGMGTSASPTWRRIEAMLSHINTRKDLTSGNKLLASVILDHYDPALGYTVATREDLKNWTAGNLRGVARAAQALHKAGVIYRSQSHRMADRFYPRFSLVLDPETGELQ